MGIILISLKNNDLLMVIIVTVEQPLPIPNRVVKPGNANGTAMIVGE